MDVRCSIDEGFALSLREQAMHFGMSVQQRDHIAQGDLRFSPFSPDDRSRDQIDGRGDAGCDPVVRFSQ
jgi:hypothetical protein